MQSQFRLIEPDVLRKATGHNEEAFIGLMEVFLRVVPDMLQHLEAAVIQNNQSDICHHAHSLKSCVALVGAASTSTKLELMEMQARRKEAFGVTRYFTALREELGQVMNEARMCLAS